MKWFEGHSQEVLIEKFLLLRDAYDELKDDTTRLEFEVESLKDAQDDGEEEVIFLILDCWTTIFTYIQMRLQKAEILHIKDKLKVLEKENDGNKIIMERQQQMIDSFVLTNMSTDLEKLEE